MERYKFRLEKLLDVRVKKEEESIRLFKDAQMQKNITEDKLNTLNSDYKKYSSEVTKGSIIQRKMTNNYLNALNDSINKTTVKLNENIVMVEKKRQELEKRQIERKTVEILKDKGKEAFEKEQNRIEQKNNDEFALYGFIRNHKSNLKGGENSGSI